MKNKEVNKTTKAKNEKTSAINLELLKIHLKKLPIGQENIAHINLKNSIKDF